MECMLWVTHNVFKCPYHDDCHNEIKYTHDFDAIVWHAYHCNCSKPAIEVLRKHMLLRMLPSCSWINIVSHVHHVNHYTFMKTLMLISNEKKSLIISVINFWQFLLGKQAFSSLNIRMIIL
ncbi:hypothetical protein HPP92_023795 [Vanilla planifolia]|uniref:Uncharacterized protein n=1 Tax=Vanilla planifolia TaxID=51239 RepID=A0A835UBZ4_VANPL|nr:hypothetical protein HPP92_023795 [Vanilla planifolia]